MAVTYNDSGQGNTIGSNDRGVLYTNYTADGPQIQFMDHAGNLVNTFADKTSARNFLDSELTFDAYNQQAAEMENLSVGQSPFGMATTMAMGEENGGFAGTGPNGPLTGPGANAGGIVPAPPAGVTQGQLGQANPLTAQPLPDGGNFMLPQVLPGAGVANTRAIGEDNSMLQPNNPNAFTRAIGEDGNFGGAIATTQASFEDGTIPSPGSVQELESLFPNENVGEIVGNILKPGQGQLTTMAVGEETGENPFPGGGDSVAITMAIGENGSTFPPGGGDLATTQAMGEEEGQPGFPGQPTPPGLFPQPPVAPPMALPGGNGKGGGGFQQPPAYQRPPNPFMGGGYGGYGGGFGGFGGGFQPQPYQQPYQPRPMYQPQPYGGGFGGGFGGGGKGGGGGFQPQPFMPQQPYQQPYQPQQQPFMQQQPGGKGGGGGFGPQDQLFGMQNQQNAQNQQMFNMQNASPNGQQMQAQPAPAGTGGASPFGSMLGAAAGGGSGNRTALF